MKKGTKTILLTAALTLQQILSGRPMKLHPHPIHHSDLTTKKTNKFPLR